MIDAYEINHIRTVEIKSNETKRFFSYKSFLFSAAVSMAPFEIYG